MSTPDVSVAFHVPRSTTRKRCTTPLCRNERRAGGNDCLECHAKWMRENRPKHSQMTAAQRQRANCRAYVNVLIRRGALKRQPCEDCGDPAGPDVRPRHNDYSKPRVISRWTCDRCERALRFSRERAAS